MDWEAALLTKAMRESDIKTPVRKGIQADHFRDPLNRTIWSYLMEHNADPDKGGVASIKYIRTKFKDFEKCNSKDTLASVADRVLERAGYGQLRKLIAEIQEKAQEEDALAAIKLLKAGAVRLSSDVGGEQIFDAAQSGAEIKAQYKLAKKLKGLTGYAFPWEQLTEDTGGANSGDFITLAGRPGTMKTWMTLAVADGIYKAGKTPLYLSKEMPKQTLARRWAALHLGLDYRKMRKGRLTKSIENEFFEALAEFDEKPPFPIAYIKSTGEEALADIQALVDDVGPDMLFIDGFYFLAERDHALTGMLTSKLKGLAVENWKIPIMVNTQLNQTHETNKENYKSAVGGAYGDSYAQDSDVFIKLQLTPELRELNEIAQIPVKIREDEGKAYITNAKPATDFSQKRLLEDDNRKNDDDEDDGPDPEDEVV